MVSFRSAGTAKNCCDREVMAWRAWEGKGLLGEPVREMLIDARWKSASAQWKRCLQTTS